MTPPTSPRRIRPRRARLGSVPDMPTTRRCPTSSERVGAGSAADEARPAAAATETVAITTTAALRRSRGTRDARRRRAPRRHAPRHRGSPPRPSLPGRAGATGSRRGTRARSTSIGRRTSGRRGALGPSRPPPSTRRRCRGSAGREMISIVTRPADGVRPRLEHRLDVDRAHPEAVEQRQRCAR